MSGALYLSRYLSNAISAVITYDFRPYSQTLFIAYSFVRVRFECNHKP